MHKFKLPRHNVPINYSKKMIVLKATDIEPYKLPPRTRKNTEVINTKSVAVETTPNRGKYQLCCTVLECVSYTFI